MTNRILVTYASRAGSTAEVAEAIAKVLTPSLPAANTADLEKVSVDVLPMQDVKDLSPYQAVIVGSAIRKSKWLPEAIQFIRTHQEALRHKPFAMFTVCITLAMSNSEQYRSAVAGWVAPVRAVVKPLSEGLFAGKLDFSKLPFNWDTLMLRLTVALGIFPRGDHRDWNAIRAWAESLKPILEV
ncbi:MAG TPA: flavodoxin domain-containing protein [Anaerolineales bacterium]|nr:flavodoxin domain-containing protein [Anaerolineales bacterium]